MELIQNRLVLSPTDLKGFLACPHLTHQELLAARGEIPRPKQDDPGIKVMTDRGLEHEAKYLESLRAEGRSIREFERPEWSKDPVEHLHSLRERARETAEAMASGVDVIFQATFLTEQGAFLWQGHADFLVRVEQPSSLGAFSYEPEDTKLARSVKPDALLQLCQYAESVEAVQGVAPSEIHVVLGDKSRRQSFRLDDLAAYYRAAKARFEATLTNWMDGWEEARPDTYPWPVSHCSLCRWKEACDTRWEEDDHLSRVANLRGDQIRKLNAAGVRTLQALASAPESLAVPGMGAETLARARRQARLQAQARLEAETRREGQMEADPPAGDHAPHSPRLAPPVERLPLEPGRGLALLPDPNAGDLFFDIEGDPYVGVDGLEYLFGLGWVDDGEFQFRAFWAHNSAEERRAFQEVVDFIQRRREQHPGMHVYHYAPYETTALGKLMGRYGTREEEFDTFLRQRVFVDLYRVVTQGLAVGSPSYSIKALEPLYMPPREGEVQDAGSSIVEYERWLEEKDQNILQGIEDYNRDDVESTWLLREWLEGQRREAVASLPSGEEITRPAMKVPTEGESDEAAEGEEGGAEDPMEEVRRQMTALLDGMEEPPDPSDREVRARWIAAHLLEWHRRDAKPGWWQYFSRLEFSVEELIDQDSEAIGGLVPVENPPETEGRSFLHTYTFDPNQDFKLSERTRTVLDPESERLKSQGLESRPSPGSIHYLDPVKGILKLKRGKKSTAPHPTALIPGSPIDNRAHRESLRRLGRALLAHGVDGSGPLEAGRRLLALRPPRVVGSVEGEPLRKAEEEALAAGVRLALGLNRSVLPVQGPPGTGKTYTAARMILALLKQGKRVGITAQSHAAISNLLKGVMEAADEAGAAGSWEPRAAQKGGKGDSTVDGDPRVQVVPTNDKIRDALQHDGVQLVAGTTWLFANSMFADLGMENSPRLDALVVDEAGQLSLANVLAVSQAADNLILVGDPQQLSQPSQGTHPEGTGGSALDHILGGEDTIPDHLGLFLETSYRMHPNVCGFISEQVYDGKLESHASCQRQELHDHGAGLRWVPVEHDGNRMDSLEEAEAIQEIFSALLGQSWTRKDGTEATLTMQDILVVAPYNAQVNLLTHRLPKGARVGTVDRFQGQEAPVVLISLTSSSAEEVPRGLDFLLSRNRLNVAISRAQVLSVMVGSPKLLAAPCRTPGQLKMVNVLCRYVELAGGGVDLLHETGERSHNS